MKELQEKLWEYFHRLDKYLIVAAMLCSVLSVVMLHSINANGVLNIGVDDSYTQAAAACLGAAAMLTAAAIDFHKIARLWYIYVPVILIMVLLTYLSWLSA